MFNEVKTFVAFACAGVVTLVVGILVVGYVEWLGGTAPAVSGVGNARVYFDSTSLTLKASYSSAAYVDIITATSGVVGAGTYGDGSDGTVTLGANTTLTRDMFYDTFSTDGFTLTTGGFRVFVKNTLTVTAGGIIRANGNAGAGTVAGAAGATGTVRDGAAGGAGGAGAGGTGSATVEAFGGAGGAGGSAASAGGAGGTSTAPIASHGSIRATPQATLGATQGFGGTTTFITGGAGGGGGGAGGGGNSSGGGGAGGGVVLVSARLIANAGAIQANGGAGAAGVSGNAGGGGGGGGGAVVLTYRSLSGVGTVTATGGTGGAGIGTGAAGTAGSAGTVIQLVN